jgi:hypothetical protein
LPLTTTVPSLFPSCSSSVCSTSSSSSSSSSCISFSDHRGCAHAYGLCKYVTTVRTNVLVHCFPISSDCMPFPPSSIPCLSTIPFSCERIIPPLHVVSLPAPPAILPLLPNSGIGNAYDGDHAYGGNTVPVHVNGDSESTATSMTSTSPNSCDEEEDTYAYDMMRQHSYSFYSSSHPSRAPGPIPSPMPFAHLFL